MSHNIVRLPSYRNKIFSPQISQELLLVSQINYTLTNFANHCEQFSHDAINRYLRGEKITPRLIWDNVRAHVVVSERGYVVFDDTVLDKNASCAIE